MDTRLTTRAHGKINLYLRVTGVRADGFHALDTLFQEIDLCDRIDWIPGGEGIRLNWLGPAIAARPQDNLALRAARALNAKLGLALAGEIRIVKRIPAGGGLGGGSSDAAAVLRLLNRAHGDPLSLSDLHDLALGLGSDVPFFICGGCQHGRGRGELLEPATRPVDWPVSGLLILPRDGISTAEVFRDLRAEPPWETPRSGPPVLGENDLLPAVRRLSPDFDRLWTGLSACQFDGALFMTGSGSTIVFLGPTPGPVSERARRAGCRIQPFRFHVRSGT